MNDGGAAFGPGARVMMHLRVASTDGDEVGSTFDDTPLDFVVGDGTLAPGLEAALEGLGPSGLQRTALEPGVAFGQRQDELVQVMPRERFPADVARGFVWSFSTPEGDDLPGTVLAVEDERVVIDFNHPLAGEPVVVDLEILAVESPVERMKS